MLLKTRDILQSPIRQYEGYTLIEILIALTIIGFLFGFGYVNFRDFSRRQALAGVAKQVQGDLRLTQQMALSGQKPPDPIGSNPSDLNCLDPYTLTGYKFNVVSGTEYEIKASCTGPGVLVAAKQVTLPDGISVSPAKLQDNTTVNPVIFPVLGRGPNIPGDVAITLTQDGTNSEVKITITPGGEIK